MTQTLNINLSAPDVLLLAARPSADPALHMVQRAVLQDPETFLPVPFDRLIHRAPTGVGYGYQGSGPSDLALNVLALHLPLDPAAPRTRSEVARRLGVPEDASSRAYAAFFQRSAEDLRTFRTLEEEMHAALPVRLMTRGLVRPVVLALTAGFRRDCVAPLAPDQDHVLTAAQVRAWITGHAPLP